MLTLALALTACGGGGGGGTPSGSGGSTGGGGSSGGGGTTTNYNTAEYRRNWGLDAIDAIHAYNAGYTGTGVTVAVIDSGADLQHPDLIGQLDAASKDMFTFRNDLDDIDGHGTMVSQIIAGAKNNSYTHGVAFDAQIMALRTDDPGTCASVDGCSFYDTDIAAAINYAVANGADVINISLGGPDPSLQVLMDAIANAVAAGVIIVVSAGNEGENGAIMPEQSALDAIDAAGPGQVIIAGSVNNLLVLSSFSNPAGSVAVYQEAFLTAPGEDVIVSLWDEASNAYVLYLVSGTSFAAPHIAGAAALLIDAFPHLSAAQVVNLLFTTAVDLGAPGIDSTYGQGFLDVGAAFSAQGVTSISVQTTQGVTLVPVNQTGLVSGAAFGDAFDRSDLLTHTIFSDAYLRGYRTDLTHRTFSFNAAPDLLGLMEAKRNFNSAELPLGQGQTMKVAVTKEDTGRYYDENGQPLTEDGGQLGYKSMRMSWKSDLGTATSLYSTFADSLTENLGFTDEAFTTAHSDATISHATGHNAYLTGRGEARRVALSQDLGKKIRLALGVGTVDIASETSQVLPTNLAPARKSAVVAQVSRSANASSWQIEAGYVREENMILGTRSSGALDFGQEAQTVYLGLASSWQLGQGLALNIGLRGGLTQVEGGQTSMFAGASDLVTSSGELSLSKTGLMQRGDRLSFAIAQPLYVETGEVVLETPVSWSYKRLEADFASEVLNLSPSGREIDVEMAYTTRLTGDWDLQTNLLHQIEPGHVAEADPVTSLFLHMKRTF